MTLVVILSLLHDGALRYLYGIHLRLQASNSISYESLTLLHFPLITSRVAGDVRVIMTPRKTTCSGLTVISR